MFSYQVAQWAEARERLKSLTSSLFTIHRAVVAHRDTTGRSFADAGNIDGQPFTMVEALLQAYRAARSLSALKLTKTKPIQVAVWNTCMSALDNLEAASRDFTSTWDGLRSRSDTLRVNSGSTVIDSNGNVTISFNDPLLRLAQHADAVLTSLAQMPVAGGAANDPEPETVADYSKETLKSASTAREAAQKTTNLVDLIKAEADEHARKKSEIEARLGELIASLEQADAHAKSRVDQLNALQSTGTEHSASLAARMDEAGRLRVKMDELRNQMASFVGSLSSAQSRLEEVEIQGNSLISTLKDDKSDIARMKADALDMLSGATVGGLAKAFGDERKALEEAMKPAFWWFVASTLLLTLSSVALAAYVLDLPISILGVDLSNKAGGSGEVTLAGVISRVALILGPFWLTLFSSRRYRQLFDLRQQYSHKYNMAFSMEGFKKQSLSNSDAIAAWVFSIVAADPIGTGGRKAPMDESPVRSIQDLARSFIEESFERLGTGKSAAKGAGD
jgi:hypothetical protein